MLISIYNYIFHLFLPDKIKVGKDKCLFRVETTSNNITSIVNSKLTTHFNGQVGLEQEFLIVSQLNNNRYIENILQPSTENIRYTANTMIYKYENLLTENKRYHMSQMHRCTGRTATSVQKERLLLFITIKNQIEFSINFAFI